MPALNASTCAGRWQRVRQALRRPFVFAGLLLAIEFLDELAFGARETAWPLLRADLGLSYAQIGLLLGVPNIASGLIEPLLGVLGDVWKRWALIVGGGLCFAIGLLATAWAPGFGVLLAASILLYPASGAFVSLSQATLMDLDPRRHAHLMARWTLAGSAGVVLGPLLLGAGVALGLGWRGAFVFLSGLAVALSLAAWRHPHLRRNGNRAEGETAGAGRGLGPGLRRAFAAMRRGAVLRWLVLLQFSDFLLDVLLGFLALYFVDVVEVTPALAGTAVAVWSGVGLAGDALLIPLLERVRGLAYLRFSALVTLVLFPAFLLVPAYWTKLLLLALMGLCNAGWYAILQGQLYSSLPGQSGTAMAVNALFGLAVGFTPAVFGWVAQQAGLPVTMWLLLLGPIALFIGLPRRSPAPQPDGG
ncbi:MAG: MFS transporter [Anaerolineales bacterium]|nr:MFS transporter [Anaerolineales bacterium]